MLGLSKKWKNLDDAVVEQQWGEIFEGAFLFSCPFVLTRNIFNLSKKKTILLPNFFDPIALWGKEWDLCSEKCNWFSLEFSLRVLLPEKKSAFTTIALLSAHF